MEAAISDKVTDANVMLYVQMKTQKATKIIKKWYESETTIPKIRIHRYSIRLFVS